MTQGVVPAFGDTKPNFLALLNRLGHSKKQINPDLPAANCKKVYLPITCRPMRVGQFAGVALLQGVLQARAAPMVKLHQLRFLLFHREMKAKDLARNFRARPGSATHHFPHVPLT